MSFRGEQKVKDKIYIYEATAVWNAEKQHSEQKHIYIGTKDPKTGKLIPNKKYYGLYGGSTESDGSMALQSAAPPQVMSSQAFGNVAIMKHAADTTGLTGILKECFPKQWESILSCAMHSCSENEALYLCKSWAEDSYNLAAPSSQRISELLLQLDVEPGCNQDHEQLPQINLAMLFGEDSKLPVFCRIYPGSIKDVSTLAGMVRFVDEIKLDQMHFFMEPQERCCGKIL